MNTSQTAPTNPNQSTQPMQLVSPSPISIENPSAWMQDGYSPTEILLAAGIITSLSLAGVATVIVAITGLVKTLVQNPDACNAAPNKTKS
jgi:hypothetical protein